MNYGVVKFIGTQMWYCFVIYCVHVDLSCKI